MRAAPAGRRPATEFRRPARERPKGRLAFVREFVANPTKMGAIIPSSKYLAAEMLRGLDIRNAKAIVEYGPGTGIVADLLEPMLPPGCVYFAIERSPDLAAVARKRHPKLKVYEDTAANVERLCRENGVEEVDIILCGLPWASFPASLQDEILSATVRVLKPGGVMVSFCYYSGTVLPPSRRFFKVLPRYFSRVTRSRPVFRNFPPAFVARCIK